MDSDLCDIDDELIFIEASKSKSSELGENFNAEDDDDFMPVFMKSQSSNGIVLPDPDAAVNETQKKTDFGSYRENNSLKNDSCELKLNIF